MDLIDHYLQRAEECRKLAQQTSIPMHRKIIEEICNTWARLAEERRAILAQRQGNKTPN